MTRWWARSATRSPGQRCSRPSRHAPRGPAGRRQAGGRWAMSNAAATGRVALGNRSYEVLSGPGLTARATDLIEARLGKARCGIVTDANVARRHLAPLEASLQAAGRHA